MQCVRNELYSIISSRKIFMGHFIRKCRYGVKKYFESMYLPLSLLNIKCYITT